VAAVDVCASFEWAGKALARPYNSTRSESRPSVAGPSSPTAPPPAFAKGLDLRESSEPVRKTARHVKSTLLAVVDMLGRPKAGMEGAARKVARAGRLVELIETHVDRWQLVQQGRRPGSGLHSPSLAVAWETLVCSGRLPVDLVVGDAGRREATYRCRRRAPPVTSAVTTTAAACCAACPPSSPPCRRSTLDGISPHTARCRSTDSSLPRPRSRPCASPTASHSLSAARQ
jgi:hypothetical protein